MRKRLLRNENAEKASKTLRRNENAVATDGLDRSVHFIQNDVLESGGPPSIVTVSKSSYDGSVVGKSRFL